jgi:hypothetical protein
MATAPSFANLERLSEPFEENGKEYILVKTKSGTTRKVRWYEEPMKKIRSTKEVLGFSKGYITIFKGDTYPVLEWFQQSVARYHNFWGWYIVSEDEVPEIIPAGVTPIQLKWEDVAFADEDQLRPESQIKEHIDSLMYDPSPSKWQGAVGDRITRYLTVTKVAELPDGYYGPSTFYLFEDEEENEYTWTTAARKLELGETYEVVGTIKSLSKYKGKEQTVLTRCRVN